MSKVYWFCKLTLGLAIFAFCILFSVYLVLEYKKGHADQRDTAAEYHSDATQHSPASCGAVMDESGLVGLLTCLADNVSADGGVKQAEYDLNAQQDMAAWALGMLIATIWMTVITLFGVFFVWRTLKATQDMACDTRGMANDTRDIGKKQVKAYLTIAKAKMSIRVDQDRVFWLVYPEVKNTGQSPATGIKVRVFQGTPIENRQNERRASVTWPDLGAGVEFADRVTTETLSSDIRFIDSEETQASVSFTVLVTAKDVFGDPIKHESWFNCVCTLVESDDLEMDRGRTVNFGMDDE